MKKRWLSVFLICFILLSMLSGCDYLEVTTGRDANLQTVNVGYRANYGSLWAVINVNELDYMKKEGLRVNFMEYPDGRMIVRALENGEIDVGYIGNGAHPECINGNAKIFALSHISNADAVIASMDINSVKDLAGKKVGYVGGTSSESILAKSLEKEGMSMDDILPVDLYQEEIVSAIKRGDIDAVAIWSPYSLEILEEVANVKK